jgi:AbrB family looped-hinge helix DNA binding protein
MNHDKKLYGTATVGTKGQVVIPADARDELDIKTGDRLYVIGSSHASAVTFIKEEQFEAFIERLNINVETLRSDVSHYKKNKE